MNRAGVASFIGRFAAIRVRWLICFACFTAGWLACFAWVVLVLFASDTALALIAQVRP